MPDAKYLEKEKDIAEKVIALLKKESRYKIDRSLNTGSTGKKTSIVGSDLDCVVFINDKEPPFGDVLEEFGGILKKASANFGLTIQRKTSFSLKFKVADKEFGDLKFDLLPAPNFVVSRPNFGGDELIDEQAEMTLNRMKDSVREKRYPYSAGLAEAQMRFFKNQDGFVNVMVRIAKYWFKGVKLPFYVSGGKYLIELVMVHAVNKEGSTSYFKCFQRFLNLLANFKSLNIIFKNELRGRTIPSYIRRQRPLVVEPVNAYNNLARNWDHESVQTIKKYAQGTNDRLNNKSKTIQDILLGKSN